MRQNNDPYLCKASVQMLRYTGLNMQALVQIEFVVKQINVPVGLAPFPRLRSDHNILEEQA